ncbi:MAG: cell shape determination protein CcmA [Acidobacteria bacterium]|nr:cell shape determination protein CcmA [Acidobacteriota bacterium]|tara:strand:- start:232 stop:795 length:564 start_codon:yes stop_codon:yes gene_type:complete
MAVMAAGLGEVGMWKREETGNSVIPAQPTEHEKSLKGVQPGAQTPERETVTIGKSIVIKGDVTGSENLTIDGKVEGKIELKQHLLTIGQYGRIQAEVFAKSVVVLGEVAGNIRASEKVAIRDNGTVEGDIVAPRVAIAEGARFRGGIDMQQNAQSKADTKSGSDSRKGQSSKTKAQAPAGPLGNQRS